MPTATPDALPACPHCGTDDAMGALRLSRTTAFYQCERCGLTWDRPAGTDAALEQTYPDQEPKVTDAALALRNAPGEHKPAERPSVMGKHGEMGHYVTFHGVPTFIPDSAGHVPARVKHAHGSRFTKAEIEHSLVSHHKEQTGDHGAATDAEFEEHGGNLAARTFRGKLPAEITDRYEKNPHMLGQFRVAKPGDTAGAKGHDALSAMGDRYFHLVESQAGGDSVNAALETAKHSNDPEVQFLAHVHRNLTKASGLQKMDPKGLRVGDKFDVNGEAFRVAEDADGFRVLKAGKDYEVPLDYLTAIPADKGTFKPGPVARKAKAAKAAPDDGIPFSRFDAGSGRWVAPVTFDPVTGRWGGLALARLTASGGTVSRGKGEKGGTHWVTVGADKDAEEGEKGGTPMLIGGDGTIHKGPKALVGRKVHELGKAHAKPAEHSAPKADAPAKDKPENRDEPAAPRTKAQWSKEAERLADASGMEDDDAKSAALLKRAEAARAKADAMKDDEPAKPAEKTAAKPAAGDDARNRAAAVPLKDAFDHAVAHLANEKFSRNRMVPQQAITEHLQKVRPGTTAAEVEKHMERAWSNKDHDISETDGTYAAQGLPKGMYVTAPKRATPAKPAGLLGHDEGAAAKGDAPAPATLAKSVEDVGREMAKTSKTGLVPIHEIRAAVAKRHGDGAATHEALDKHILDLTRKGARVISVSDTRQLSAKQLEDSISDGYETLAYVDFGGAKGTKLSRFDPASGLWLSTGHLFAEHLHPRDADGKWVEAGASGNQRHLFDPGAKAWVKLPAQHVEVAHAEAGRPAVLDPNRPPHGVDPKKWAEKVNRLRTAKAAAEKPAVKPQSAPAAVEPDAPRVPQADPGTVRAHAAREQEQRTLAGQATEKAAAAVDESKNLFGAPRAVEKGEGLFGENTLNKPAAPAGEKAPARVGSASANDPKHTAPMFPAGNNPNAATQPPNVPSSPLKPGESVRDAATRIGAELHKGGMDRRQAWIEANRRVAGAMQGGKAADRERGAQHNKASLESFKRRTDAEHAATQQHRAEVDATGVKTWDATWGQMEGTDILQIPGHEMAAIPATGKRNAKTFQVFNTKTREPIVQVDKSEVHGWLAKHAQANGVPHTSVYRPATMPATAPAANAGASSAPKAPKPLPVTPQHKLTHWQSEDGTQERVYVDHPSHMAGLRAYVYKHPETGELVVGSSGNRTGWADRDLARTVQPIVDAAGGDFDRIKAVASKPDAAKVQARRDANAAQATARWKAAAETNRKLAAEAQAAHEAGRASREADKAARESRLASREMVTLPGGTKVSRATYEAMQRRKAGGADEGIPFSRFDAASGRWLSLGLFDGGMASGGTGHLWEEKKHPRADDGKFAEKGGGTATAEKPSTYVHESAGSAAKAGKSYGDWRERVHDAFRNEQIDEDHPAFKQTAGPSQGGVDGRKFNAARDLYGKHVRTDNGHFGVVTDIADDASHAIVTHDDGTTSKHDPEWMSHAFGELKERAERKKDISAHLAYLAPKMAAEAIERNENISETMKRHGLPPLTPGLRGAIATEVTKQRPPAMPKPSPRPPADALQVRPDDAPVAPAAKPAGDVPDWLHNSLKQSVAAVKEHNKAVEGARDLEKRIGGAGRYEHDTRRNGAKRLDSALKTIAEFRQHAPGEGVDADAYLKKLGHVEPHAESPAAKAWRVDDEEADAARKNRQSAALSRFDPAAGRWAATPAPVSGPIYLSLDAPAATPLPMGLAGYPTTEHGLPVTYFRKRVISEGEYRHPKTGQRFTVDAKRIKKWADTAKRMLSLGRDIPVPIDHSFRAEDNRGWAIGAEPEVDPVTGRHSLSMTLKMLGSDAALLAARNRCSIYIDPNYVDETGQSHQDAIVHVALTPVPVIGGCGAFIPTDAPALAA